MQNSALEQKMEKLESKLENDFCKSTKSGDPDQLKALALELAQKVEDIEDQKKSDPKLNAAKEIVKDLASGYRDVKKLNQLKLQYVLAVMQEREIK